MITVTRYRIDPTEVLLVLLHHCVNRIDRFASDCGCRDRFLARLRRHRLRDLAGTGTPSGELLACHCGAAPESRGVRRRDPIAFELLVEPGDRE